MAHHKSAKKRIRLSEVRRQRNRYYRAMMKTAVKKVKEAQDQTTATNQLPEAYSVIDKLVAKGIITRNKAANKKSRLTRYVNSMA
ncbi:30S ribosomal protein S20 [Candidatus Saccharibacteria bacterium]|nr:30S ribosomal protein S20 [Candidatus Saccharibacteria bacterium]NIV04335.1 30S ribosomal protein S20 [Calditrichia bacterium]NIW80429.1 30S ribosomal protein S20 [Calditrichia bacterium]